MDNKQPEPVSPDLSQSTGPDYQQGVVKEDQIAAPVITPQPQVSDPFALPGTDNTANPETDRRKNIRPIFIAILAAAFIFGGAMFGYVGFMNSSDKIFEDAFYNTSRQTKGILQTAYTESGTSNIVFSLDGKWASKKAALEVLFENRDIGVKSSKGNILIENSKIYVKSQDTLDMLKQISNQYPEVVKSPLGVESLDDNKWVTITEDQIYAKAGSEKKYTKQLSCIQDAVWGYQTDQQQQKEIYEYYAVNKFLKLQKQKDEPVGGRIAYHFLATVDDTAMTSFIEALKKTALSNKIGKCADITQLKKMISRGSSETQSKIDLWVDKESRTWRRIGIRSSDNIGGTQQDISFMGTFDFSSPVNVELPQPDNISNYPQL